MKFTARQIAEFIGGKVEGNEDVAISQVVKIDEESDGGLSFLANPKYEQFIYSTGADIVIVGTDFKPEKDLKPTLIRVDEPYLAIATLLDMYNSMKLDKRGISELAFVDESARIDEVICFGCGVCAQLCPTGAIKERG